MVLPGVLWGALSGDDDGAPKLERLCSKEVPTHSAVEGLAGLECPCVPDRLTGRYYR